MKRQPGRPRAQAKAPRLGGACGQSKRGRSARATHHLRSYSGITVPKDPDFRDPSVGKGGAGGMSSEGEVLASWRTA